MLALEEIRRCYDIFPITVGFRKYAPMDSRHEAFLDAIGFKSGNRYIVGDFIGGNRHRARCVALNDENLCSLHAEGRKPLQCRIVPFCAIYPEYGQNIIFREQRETKFSKCRGFRTAGEKDTIVWSEGRFTDSDYRDAFYGYRNSLVEQKPIMGRILEDIKPQRAYDDFLKGEGILETFIPPSMIFDVLEAGMFRIEEYYDFLRIQGRLCYIELSSGHPVGQVLEDYLGALNKIAEFYAAFIRKQKDTPEGSGTQ